MIYRISRWKPVWRWLILGGAFGFLGKVFLENWQQVAAIRIDAAGWASLAIATGITLFAHIWAGWVWSYTLRQFQQPVPAIWMIQTYLKTNIAKYLPGNVWHYYSRVTAATKAGASLAAASVSVLLEPLLMAAAALLLAVLCSRQIATQYGVLVLFLQAASLAAILAGVHPKILNRLIARVGKLKPGANQGATPFRIDRYPWQPFLGELGFVLLRGLGFLLTFHAIAPIAADQWAVIFGAFSVAWLFGLVIPGAPGGIGVFEATVLALLRSLYAPGVLLSIVALYRLISVVSEAGGAGLAWLEQRRSGVPFA
jgi:uncharacterized membrane protein YbhN (UPF0104 family)